MARLLPHGGRFVFSILHPCFPGVNGVSGSWPTHDGYYVEGWWLADGERSVLRRKVGATHRMLSTYLNALSERGMALEAMIEPPPEGEWVANRPGAEGLPVFLVTSWIRVG